MTEVRLKESKLKPFAVTELEIPIKGLSESLNGFLMVQMADLHTGVYTSMELIEKVISFVTTLNPNLILHTGDFVHTGRRDFRELLFKTLGPNISRFRHYKRLARIYSKELGAMLETLTPSHGSYAVWGNHDHIEGIRTIMRYLPKGITILNNNSSFIPNTNSKISISGIDDFRLGKPSITDTVSSLKKLEVEKDAFKILLNHNPDAFFAKDKDLIKEFNLILCGHTHGGQVCMPGSIAITTQTKSREYYVGLERLGKNTIIYTSRGIGCSGVPFRLFCDPEVVVIRLVKG